MQILFPQEGGVFSLLKCGLCIMTSLQRGQYGKGRGESNLGVEEPNK